MICVVFQKPLCSCQSSPLSGSFFRTPWWTPTGVVLKLPNKWLKLQWALNRKKVPNISWNNHPKCHAIWGALSWDLCPARSPVYLCTKCSAFFSRSNLSFPATISDAALKRLNINAETNKTYPKVYPKQLHIHWKSQAHHSPFKTIWYQTLFLGLFEYLHAPLAHMPGKGLIATAHRQGSNQIRACNFM